MFAALKKFDYTVPLGALLGTVFARRRLLPAGNEHSGGARQGRGRAEVHARDVYGADAALRAVSGAGGTDPCFNAVATAVPLLLPQLVIYAMRALGLYKPEKAAPAPGEETKKERDEA